MEKLDFIYNRHSVRIFEDKMIPIEDIEAIIQAATYAPSGVNSQNWHFVVIKDQAIIHQMVKIIEDKNEQISHYIEDEDQRQAFRKYVKYHTVFKNAPVVIVVYAGPYDTSSKELLIKMGASHEEIEDFLKPSPGIQNVSAAMENLLLAATAKGYGTCWMTGPNYARKELEALIGLEKEGYYIAAMTPLGVPRHIPETHPPRKPINEVMTII